MKISHSNFSCWKNVVYNDKHVSLWNDRTKKSKNKAHTLLAKKNTWNSNDSINKWRYINKWRTHSVKRTFRMQFQCRFNDVWFIDSSLCVFFDRKYWERFMLFQQFSLEFSSVFLPFDIEFNRQHSSIGLSSEHSHELFTLFFVRNGLRHWIHYGCSKWAINYSTTVYDWHAPAVLLWLSLSLSLSSFTYTNTPKILTCIGNGHCREDIYNWSIQELTKSGPRIKLYSKLEQETLIFFWNVFFSSYAISW